MNKHKTLWIISGPTAVGKTDFSIGLAKQLRSPIISADSRQIYNELNIGVAKPSEAQLSEIRHYFINHIGIHEPYSAGQYATEARHLINNLFDTHEQLVVCGGTGLYIQALLKGLDNLPKRNEQLRSELETALHEKGIPYLQQMLKLLNPSKFDNMDVNNPQRLIRAIEIEKSETVKIAEIPAFRHSIEIKSTILELPRAELYERINKRVDIMIDEGLEAEAEKLADYQQLNALQTVGYAEWWPYFKGEVSLEQVIDKIKQHTRNYAKRQMTWIRNRG